MKLYKSTLLIPVLMACLLGACKEENIDNTHHYTNKLYVSSAPVCDDLLIKSNISEEMREIAYRIAAPANQDIMIEFDANPSLTAAYNLAYNDNASALAEKYYSIEEKKTVIKAGDVSSDNISVAFKDINELDKSKRYVLPVTIMNASNIEVLESARTIYFVFKGAALINVVANIKQIFFPITWKSTVNSLPIVTVEALLRSDDWVAGRDNALSTVFGIEGSFLVRIGDSDRPRNQLQVVAPGGNFPGPNIVPGLPENEWVHIAIVYNSVSKDRIFYKDGVQVYKDQLASNVLNLTSNCFIGKSWNNERWLAADIAEVRIWNVERTAEEIAKNPYEVNPTNEGLIAYWKFNEGGGNSITDQTGNGNNIVGSGDPVWVSVEIPSLK